MWSLLNKVILNYFPLSFPLGNIILQNGMHSLEGRVDIDDVNIYALTTEVKSVNQKNKVQYSPMIELKRPGAKNVQMMGIIELEEPMKSLAMDMRLTGIQKLPYTFKCKLN